MNIHVGTFASKKFEKQQKRQAKILLDIGFSQSNIHLFNPTKLDDQFYNSHPYASETNKFDWYSFKPYFLGMLLNNIKKGDVLLYLDVNDKPILGIKEYIENQFLSAKDLDILSCGTNYPNFKYLSSFHKSNLTFDLIFESLFLFQPETGAIAIRNSEKSISILKIWYELTVINSYLLNQKDYIINPSRPDQETMFIISRIYKTVKIESWIKYKLLGKGLRKFVQFEALRNF